MRGTLFGSLLSKYRGPAEKAPSLKYRVQDKKASNYEYFFSLALDKLGLEYVFQYPFNSGRSIAGGFMLDFLVLTVPMPTPVWVNGEYWHRTGQTNEDILQAAILATEMGLQWNPAIVLWGADVDTPQHALVSARRELL